MPPITTMAMSSPENATASGSAEAKRWLNTDNVPASADHGRRDHEADELVAVGRIADEARALLVLADRHQHAADRRAVKAPEQVADGEAERGDQPVVGPVALEVDAEHGRARDAAEPALAAGELGPAIGDREQQRGQRQRQQREVDAAPAQDQRAGERRGHGDEQDREQRRQDDVAGEPVPLAQRRRVGAEPEPGAVAERDEPGIADENVEPHAGDGEDHHVDRRAQRQARPRRARTAAGHQRQRGNDERAHGPCASTRISGCARRTGRAAAAAGRAPSADTSTPRPRTG